MSGLTITHVLGDITTALPKRKKPRGSREAFQTTASDDTDIVDIKVEDLASVLVRFDNGAKGTFSVGQVCAGHKNDLVLEICGSKASVKWRQEHQNELWFGHRDRANEILQKDPSLIVDSARQYAHLPGGHQEAWADAFCNLMRDIYGASPPASPIATLPPTVATFEDGYRANRIVEAILDERQHGGVWTAVSQLPIRIHQLPKIMTQRVFAEVHESRHPDSGAAGADAARCARRRPRSRDRGLARLRT